MLALLVAPKSVFSWKVWSRPSEPLHSLDTLRVMMLITPPMASEPYSVDIGPRITSMRSMADRGGMKLVDVSPKPLGVTLPAAFWRRPSMRRSEEHTSELQSRENLVCR